MFQQELFKKLQHQLPKSISLLEAVAVALEVSYDAAHRRVSLKSKLSLAEGVQLAQYYNLSLDTLFATTNEDYVAVRKTQNIVNESDLQAYFENSYQLLSQVFSGADNKILYSAKDIPLFYTLSNTSLTRFKFYTWLKMLDVNFKPSSFENFQPKLGLVQAAANLEQIYKGLNITEIWDVTTINSTLKQIHFYYKANQVSVETAILLCDEVNVLIGKLAQRVSENLGDYQLYYNELFLMNNNVLVTTPTQQMIYVPFSILSYYTTSDELTCKEAEDFLNRQLSGSKLLNTSGEMERELFFNKMYKKVTVLKQLIHATQEFDFE